MYLKYCLLVFSGIFFYSTVLFSQQANLAPPNFVFSWQKANGDQYAIPVENNLKIQIEQQRVNRALMQILLKSVLKSRDFEAFEPLQFSLYPRAKDQIAKLEFTILGKGTQVQELTYYFRFDAYGNVFNQLEN